MMLVIAGSLGCEGAPALRSRDLQSTTTKVGGLATCESLRQTTTMVDRDGAILEAWALRLQDVVNDKLPQAPAFMAYRAAIERNSANVRQPVADTPVVHTEAEAAMWRDERYNNDLVFRGAVGSIGPISCLDALLFSRQASRVSEIDHPTEFLASVLRRPASTGTDTDVVVVFGAGSEMFPPKSVYGFDVVRRFRGEGWSYWYAIHNHTIQKNGNRLALGVPAPSTSDVAFYRSLGEELGLDSLRVTNGFYTFSASTKDLSAFRP